MTRTTAFQSASFAAIVAGAFLVRNAVAMIGLASVTLFALFSV
ncbi:MAG: hypothetical protein AB7V13_26240 [Pseudorhodoplanes sp.]